MTLDSSQLGFDGLLADAEGANRAHRFERETGHLPDTMDEAVPFMRLLIRQHHAAMLDANVDSAMELRREARRLALRLNRGEPGIIAGDDAPGCMLERLCSAPSGAVPLYGQNGVFVIDVDGMAVRVALEGFFGIGASVYFWPGFSVTAVDVDRPFLSETGYRSFLGIGADPAAGLTPDDFVRKVVAAYIEQELRGKPVMIAERWRKDRSGDG